MYMLFKLKIITLLSLLPFTPPLKSSNHTHTPEDVLSLSVSPHTSLKHPLEVLRKSDFPAQEVTSLESIST